MLLDGDADGGGVASSGQTYQIGGYAGERRGREGNSAVDCRGGCGGLSSQQLTLCADLMRGAGWAPGVKSLKEGYRAAGHGVAVGVEQAQGDLARAVEAGCRGDLLAFGERADGENLGGNAGLIGDGGGAAQGNDAAAGHLPRHGLAGQGNAALEHQCLDGPTEGGPGSKGKLGREGG